MNIHLKQYYGSQYAFYWVWHNTACFCTISNLLVDKEVMGTKSDVYNVKSNNYNLTCLFIAIAEFFHAICIMTGKIVRPRFCWKSYVMTGRINTACFISGSDLIFIIEWTILNNLLWVIPFPMKVNPKLNVKTHKENFWKTTSMIIIYTSWFLVTGKVYFLNARTEGA